MTSRRQQRSFFVFNGIAILSPTASLVSNSGGQRWNKNRSVAGCSCARVFAGFEWHSCCVPRWQLIQISTGEGRDFFSVWLQKERTHSFIYLQLHRLQAPPKIITPLLSTANDCLQAALLTQSTNEWQHCDIFFLVNKSLVRGVMSWNTFLVVCQWI